MKEIMLNACSCRLFSTATAILQLRRLAPQCVPLGPRDSSISDDCAEFGSSRESSLQNGSAEAGAGGLPSMRCGETARFPRRPTLAAAPVPRSPMRRAERFLVTRTPAPRHGRDFHACAVAQTDLRASSRIGRVSKPVFRLAAMAAARTRANTGRAAAYCSKLNKRVQSMAKHPTVNRWATKAPMRPHERGWRTAPTTRLPSLTWRSMNCLGESPRINCVPSRVSCIDEEGRTP